MTDIVERMRAHITNRGGLSRDADGNPVAPNGAWAMMLEAADEIEAMRREWLRTLKDHIFRAEAAEKRADEISTAIVENVSPNLSEDGVWTGSPIDALIATSARIDALTAWNAARAMDIADLGGTVGDLTTRLKEAEALLKGRACRTDCNECDSDHDITWCGADFRAYFEKHKEPA
ncbi:hypothetical protein V5G24_20040 [Xanthobacter sp. VTT E-85241]|uniref:hypothetical protein n=1 Tax=Roseixanthobacter finlandensis TaxID=3119922 RepID=UPI003729B155